MATTDDKKIIFSMVGVSKIIQQNQKQVLKMKEKGFRLEF